MAFLDCDICDGSNYTEENPFVEVRTPRPSDRSCMTCTLAGHSVCIRNGIATPLPDPQDIELVSGGIATPERWERWIESETADANGFLFLD